MSLSKRNKILAIILFIGLIGAFVVYKVIYKPHPTIENQTATFVGEAETFKIEAVKYQEKWLNNVVVIKGKITEKDNKGIMLNNSIYCQFKDQQTLSALSIATLVKIKGRFIGYDDLLEEVKLDQCIQLKND